ncbi:Oxoglutarate and iron-dependent oxygenase degradation C-term-domain-containing protein [Peziza echinospora]|nr:Oxoglutarate and iron-dependent oxygenase degradation C-term-domain-containing protein [Peziza echinospora]
MSAIKRKSPITSAPPTSKKKRSGSKLNPANAVESKPKAEVVAADSLPVEASFADKLFDDPVKDGYRDFYASSEPYKHAVIQPLISDPLLRGVRKEILANLHFTRKETDIYRIHQSGDLANLSGLDKSSLKLLPSLLQLRNSLYSPQFREYISHVTKCGPLSGKKTDMAINVYTKGCHLLCHDDVIGSRRVSYILYLTDPDDPWQPKWGGALRLYPTTLMEDGKSKVPSSEWSKVIPPAWNQLSFFAVQPGESFHDVEEVHEAGKIRMAISGWFHIPQKGEDGYIEGEEESLAERSSLQQLQSKSDTYDLPQPNTVYYPDVGSDKENDAGVEESDDSILTEEDIEFLLKYISPTYLTPGTLEDLNDELTENSSIQLLNFLSNKYAAKVKAYIEERDGKSDESGKIGSEGKEGWKVARPPHKHRFMYLQDAPTTPAPKTKSKDKKKKDKKAAAAAETEENPISELISKCFSSPPFRKLLQIATGLKVTNHDILARRFRRGLDYTLATGWEPELDSPKDGNMKIELCLGLTPSKGWDGADDDDEEEEVEGKEKSTDGDSSKPKSKKSKPAPVPKKVEHTPFSDEGAGVGGYEMYMTGDDDEDAADGDKKKADPAIYKAATDDEDDAMVFSMGATWNRMSIVLRDGGLLKFVKYISKSAGGDRWDVVGGWGAIAQDGDSDGSDEESGSGSDEDEDDDDDDEDDGEEWAGIQD